MAAEKTLYERKKRETMLGRQDCFIYREKNNNNINKNIILNFYFIYIFLCLFHGQFRGGIQRRFFGMPRVTI